MIKPFGRVPQRHLSTLQCLIGSAAIGCAGVAGMAFNAGDDIGTLIFATLALAGLVCTAARP